MYVRREATRSFWAEQSGHHAKVCVISTTHSLTHPVLEGFGDMK